MRREKRVKSSPSLVFFPQTHGSAWVAWPRGRRRPGVSSLCVQDLFAIDIRFALNLSFFAGITANFCIFARTKTNLNRKAK